jgi:hypothetical protein
MRVAEMPIALRPMAKKTPSGDKEPVNFRMNGLLLDRARTFIRSQQLPTTLTALVETALREFLDRNETSKRPKS